MEAALIKKFLYDFQTDRSLINLAEKLPPEYRAQSQTALSIKKQFQLEIIENALSTLDDRERFVINIHLIQHCTWPETALRYSNIYGKERELTERTLMRIQNKALSKLSLYLSQFDFKNLFL